MKITYQVSSEGDQVVPLTAIKVIVKTGLKWHVSFCFQSLAPYFISLLVSRELTLPDK